MAGSERLSVMHGLVDTAGQASYSVQGLTELGDDAALVLRADRRPDCKGRRVPLPISIRGLPSMFAACARHDVMHFHSGGTFLIRNLDLLLFRLLRKQLIMEFHGSDLRRYSLARQSNPYSPDPLPNEESLARRNLRLTHLVKTFVLHDEELRPYVPASASRVIFVPLRMDPFGVEPDYPSPARESITIVHAPSRRALKGTEHVIAAVERLKQRHDVTLKLVEGVPHDAALELYREADIVVDQLAVTTYGVFSLEGMALGKPVVTHLSDDMRKTFPDELPIVSATPATVEQALDGLIADGARRQQIGRAGRQYVEKYHDYRKVAQLLHAIYTGEAAPATSLEAFEWVGRLSG